MEKGNRSTSSRLGGTPPFECDVGLGLKMQHQGGTIDESFSYPSKRAMISPHFLPFQQYPHLHLGGSAFSSGGGGGGGIGSLNSGSHFFNSTSNQLFAASLKNTYDTALTPGAGAAATRAPFTTSQWHEFERQNMIFKYLTAYNSVPADLLLPFSRNPTSQTNHLGMEFKFSSGSDPEPWRCKRTDGKKWRCTRDVAPDQKYCERHAHKSRPRSRKHVEIQSHNLNNVTTNHSQQIDTPILGNQISSSSRKGSSTTYDQTRSIEWLMIGGTPPTSTISQVSTCNVEQKKQQIQSSARMGLLERGGGSSNFYKNPTIFQQQENDQDKQEKNQLNPYMGNDYYPYFDLKVMNSSSQRSPTRHFTDSWPLDEIGNNKGSFSIFSGSRELPLSSLTLSMWGGDRVVEENEPESMKSQWTMMSNDSWLNSTGGPLGEALCLGNVGIGKGTSDLPSPHGYNNSWSNTTSSCSKGSCEEGNHQINFIG